MNYKISDLSCINNKSKSDCCGNDTQKSSCCSDSERAMEQKDSDSCPVCGNTGMSVENITVKHMIKTKLTKQIGTYDYNLCLNEECEVAYYNRDLDIIFYKNDVKVPIWFKNDANPKYVCYCNKITEEQIIKAVMEHDIKNIKDVVLFINGDMKCQCKINNPTGKCCTRVFNDAINKGLTIKNNRAEGTVDRKP